MMGALALLFFVLLTAPVVKGVPPETVEMCMSGTSAYRAFFFTSPSFVYPLEAVDIDDYTVGLFTPRGSFARPLDEFAWYNISIESIRGLQLAPPMPWRPPGKGASESDAVLEYLSILQSLRTIANDTVAEALRQRATADDHSHTDADSEGHLRTYRHIVPNVFYTAERSHAYRSGSARVVTQESHGITPAPELDCADDGTVIDRSRMCVAPSFHTSLWAHGEEIPTAEKTGRISLGLPALGFYHRKDVSGNAGAAFHDMLYDRALLSDESFRAVPPLFPHVTDAAAILYGSVFSHGASASIAKSFSTHFSLMLCRYSLTLYPWNERSLRQAANQTMSRGKPDTNGSRSRLDLRLSAPRHGAAYVSDILFGTSLHMHITLTSEKIAHDANQQLTVALHRTLTGHVSLGNFTDLYPDALLHGWLALSGHQLIFAQPQLDDLADVAWGKLDPSLKYNHEESAEGELLHVVRFGPCGMESVLKAISYIENRTSHGASAAAGAVPHEYAEYFLGDVLGVYVMNEENRFAPFYITQCAAGALPPPKALLIMSKLTFFSTVAVAIITTIVIYLLLGRIVFMLSFSEPRVQQLIAIRTITMTYHLPYFWFRGDSNQAVSMNNDDSSVITLAHAAASPRIATPQAPASFLEYLGNIMSDHLATLQQVFVEPDPFDAGGLPPFQQRPATVSTPPIAATSPVSSSPATGTSSPVTASVNIAHIEGVAHNSELSQVIEQNTVSQGSADIGNDWEDT